MHTTRKFFILIALLVLAITIVPAVSAQDGIESLCLVTDIGRVNDGTFNQFAHEGGTSVSDDYELDYEYIETTSSEEYEGNIQACLDEGFDVIVTVGFLLADATLAAADANPDVYFIGVDQFFMGVPENLVGIQFPEDQAGFLAGVLAAMVANANDADVIAGVYGLQAVPPVVKFRNGYEQGALYVNPDWEVGTNMLGTYMDSFEDLAGGASVANQFIGEGAYVIFGAGGQTGSAAIAEAASQGVYVIGVDQDEYFTTFAGGETEGAEFLISSAMKRVDLAVYDLVAALAEGDMETWGEYAGNIFVGDVDYGPVHDSDIPEEFYDELEYVLELLLEGCLSTGVDPVSGELLSEEDAAMFEPAEGCEDLMMDD